MEVCRHNGKRWQNKRIIAHTKIKNKIKKYWKHGSLHWKYESHTALFRHYITALALNGECRYFWVNSFFFPYFSPFGLILKAEVPQESEMWHQPLRTPRAHFTLTAWCSLLSQVYFLAAVNQISVPFVIFNTNLKCPSLCFYSRNSHCLQMKLQALWAHFTFIFMTDEIRQEPSEPDTRICRRVRADSGSIVTLCTLLTVPEEPLLTFR